MEKTKRLLAKITGEEYGKGATTPTAEELDELDMLVRKARAVALGSSEDEKAEGNVCVLD